MSEPRRYRVTERNGSLAVTGTVQGIGGMLAGRDALDTLYHCAARASIGKPMRAIYEPEPGFCEMYPEYSAAGNGAADRVALRGATIEVAR